MAFPPKRWSSLWGFLARIVPCSRAGPVRAIDFSPFFAYCERGLFAGRTICLKSVWRAVGRSYCR